VGSLLPTAPYIRYSLTCLEPAAYHLPPDETIEAKMKTTRQFLIIAVAIWLSGSAPSISQGQDTEPRIFTMPRDTIELGQYMAVIYDYVDSAGHVTSVVGKLVIFKNSIEELVSEDGGGISNLCAYDASRLENCYIRDINGDGLDDILVSIYTGGANCCFGANLYSVGDSLRLIFHIEPNLRYFELVDLEQDHIPEFIVGDENFAHWKDTYREFMPILIWRWDGDKYRLANSRFPDYVMQEYNAADPCDNLWGWVIDLSYAGRVAEADSIFMYCWPDSVPGKIKEFQAFKKRLESGKFWQELQQSDW
jgi:hypothetical protein